MSGLRFERPPSWLWKSGNPAVWAGFPSEAGKSEGLFHGASFPQTSPGELVSTQEDKAIPERCRNLRHAARTEYSKCGLDVRRP